MFMRNRRICEVAWPDKRLAISALAALSFLLTACSNEKTAQESAVPVELPAGAKALQGAEVQSVAQDIKQSGTSAITPGDFIVEGEKRFNGWFLSAERIVFKPGARLIFTKSALEARPNFFILAKEIVAEDQENPGTITWERLPVVAAPDSGAATAGVDNSTSENTAGGAGSAGATGNSGINGRDAPGLTLTTLSVKNALLVDMQGQAGGSGGKGQTGGRGGGGGYGNPASQNAYKCTRGASAGAAGGPGGEGGKGGPSGGGGRGGTFTLITSPENVAAATRLLRVNVAGGTSGTSSGVGGDPGAGGSGGPGGAGKNPHCKGSGPGSSGPAGKRGTPGDQGPAGSIGDYFVGELDPTSVTELLTKR